MMKKISLLLISSLFIFASCGKEETPKYDFYEYRDDRTDDSLNLYEGKESVDEFHLHNWYPNDESKTVEVDEDPISGVTQVTYNKKTGNEYAFLYTPVCGRLADFFYINIVGKGVPGKGITFRLLYGQNDEEDTNVLGNDVSFSLSSDYEIHSLKVKGTMQTRMDLLRKVAIYPEVGLAGNYETKINGTFFFNDVYFSKELPEGAHLENPGVDTGDTSVNINGWKTQGWTFYSLYNINGYTGVSYAKAAEWGFIEKDFEINEGDNSLRFVFENIVKGKSESVTSIRFIVRGDVSRHVPASEDVPYEYDEYYEYPVYDYDYSEENKDKEVQPDENGVTTLEISLSAAIVALDGHHEDGYRLVLMIESHPDDYSKYEWNRGGELLIHGFETFYEEEKVDYYSMSGEPAVGSITLSEKDDVDKNITYEGLAGDAYWPRVNRIMVDTTHESVIKLTIRNNGENTVKIQVHAGVANDERSDSLNNMFYPLWNNRGLGDDGKYFDDGESLELTPNESKTIEISVDAPTETNKITDEDTISLLQFLVDNCWGDNKTRSGDVDIVSVVIE